MRRILTQQGIPLADLIVEKPRLESDEALLGVGSTDVWSYAGFVRAPRLLLCDARSHVWFENLVLIGLFHVTGSPEDFAARLYSRTGPRGEPFNERLLRDTTHQVVRALTEHLGRTVAPREKAGIFEVLARHATEDSRPDPLKAANDGMTHFLLDVPAWKWLSGLVRGSHVMAFDQAPFSASCVTAVRNWLDLTNARLGLCFFIEREVAFEPPAAELPDSESARVIIHESDGKLVLRAMQEWSQSLPPKKKRKASGNKGMLMMDDDWEAWCERIMSTDGLMQDQITELAAALHKAP